MDASSRFGIFAAVENNAACSFFVEPVFTPCYSASGNEVGIRLDRGYGVEYFRKRLPVRTGLIPMNDIPDRFLVEPFLKRLRLAEDALFQINQISDLGKSHGTQGIQKIGFILRLLTGFGKDIP